MAEIVRVINKGDSEVVARYERREYRIAPGAETVLEVEAAAVNFGNWLARGEERERSYRHLRGKYGAPVDEQVPTFNPDGSFDKLVPSDVVWEQVKPNVDIFDLAGTKFTTVIDDPTGETMSAVAATDDDKARMIQALRERLDSLESDLELERAKGERVQAPADDPASAPAPRKRKAKIEA